jgi:hypothetical protein
VTAMKAGPATRRQGPRHLSTVRNDTPPKVITLAGARVITPDGLTAAAPPFAPAGEVLDRLAAVVGPNGTILVAPGEPSWAYLTDCPDGWAMRGSRAWFTIMKGGIRLRVGLIGEMTAEDTPLLGPDIPSTARRFTRFTELTGTPWYCDGGVTFAILLEEALRVKDAPLRAWKNPDAPRVSEPQWPGPWADGRKHDALVTVDKNGQFLCSLNSALLPLDALRRSKVPYATSTKLMVGLWHVETPPNPEPRLPHPMGASAKPGEWRWVAQPTVEMLHEAGAHVVADDAWLCPRSRARRLMVPVYERLRDARAAAVAGGCDDADAVREAVKSVYARGVLGLDSPARQWSRPDWKVFLLAEARNGLYRAMLRAGRDEDRWPAETRTDSVAYEGTLPVVFRIGTGMGQWKETK